MLGTRTMIAVILHGNLRTFFMPLRENNSIRICDIFHSNIIKPNKSVDLFVVTDTTDFYYEGIHYFDETERGIVKDTRFIKGSDFMSAGQAKSILASQLHKFLGKNIKSIEIHDVIDVTKDEKFILLNGSNGCIPEKIPGRIKGCVPERIVSQYLKIKLAYELLRQYETQKSIHYDLIFRGRFDNLYGPTPLNLLDFDYTTHDMFVPGPGGDAPIIYDWAAFGTRQAMNLALNLYDQLGFTLANRLYRCRCMKCETVRCGEMTECNCNYRMEYEEMTLSSEYHLYRLCKDNNIRFATGCHGSPYRYS